MSDKPNYEALYLRERHCNDEWRRFAAWLQGCYGDIPESLDDAELRTRALGALRLLGFPKNVWNEKEPLP